MAKHRLVKKVHHFEPSDQTHFDLELEDITKDGDERSHFQYRLYRIFYGHPDIQLSLVWSGADFWAGPQRRADERELAYALLDLLVEAPRQNPEDFEDELVSWASTEEASELRNCAVLEEWRSLNE